MDCRTFESVAWCFSTETLSANGSAAKQQIDLFADDLISFLGPGNVLGVI
jgi:hypothetical protein